MTIGVFIIPIEAVLWIITEVRQCRSGVPSRVNAMLLFLSAVVFAICIFGYAYSMNNVISEGQIKDIEIYAINQGYYMVIDQKMVKLSEKQASEARDTKLWYHFEYQYNKLIPDQFTMLTFEVDALQEEP